MWLQQVAQAKLSGNTAEVAILFATKYGQRGTNEVAVSGHRMHEDLRVSENTIWNAVGKLERAGLIRLKKRGGRGRANIYEWIVKVPPASSAVEEEGDAKEPKELGTIDADCPQNCELLSPKSRAIVPKILGTYPYNPESPVHARARVREGDAFDDPRCAQGFQVFLAEWENKEDQMAAWGPFQAIWLRVGTDAILEKAREARVAERDRARQHQRSPTFAKPGTWLKKQSWSAPEDRKAIPGGAPSSAARKWIQRDSEQGRAWEAYHLRVRDLRSVGSKPFYHGEPGGRWEDSSWPPDHEASGAATDRPSASSESPPEL